MASIRFADLQARPTEFLDCTSLTLDEFQQLVPPFEAAFQAHMAAWRLDGKPRTARKFSVYQNCPLPTPEDRVLFILAYVKTYGLQVVQGACSAWARARPTNGSTCSCLCCSRPCTPSAMPPPVLSAPSPSALASQRLTRSPWSHRWRRRQHPSSAHQPPRQTPPCYTYCLSSFKGSSQNICFLMNWS